MCIRDRGKIVGGGMPMGVYGGRREIMEAVSPLGKVYQAGTLSGNPIATAAGIATSVSYTHLQELLKYLNIYSGERATAHLFKVCCGFDSMVLGEDEILGQVRDAYQAALEKKHVDYELNVLFQRAIACAKRIRTCLLYTSESPFCAENIRAVKFVGFILLFLGLASKILYLLGLSLIHILKQIS